MLSKGGDSGTVANMRPNFFSHISIEMRKVLLRFFLFAYLSLHEEAFRMVFCVSLSGCMVYIVISFFVIVLKDRRLSDFWVVREAFFFGG